VHAFQENFKKFESTKVIEVISAAFRLSWISLQLFRITFFPLFFNFFLTDATVYIKTTYIFILMNLEQKKLKFINTFDVYNRAMPIVM
jgi:hypothetical protein